MMEKVVISLPTKNTSVPSLSLDSHFEHFKYFPDYTQILMILPENRINEVKTKLAEHSVQNKINIYPFKTITLERGYMYLIFAESDKLMDSGLIENLVIPKGTVWAQDLFKPAKSLNGKTMLVVPDAYKMFYSGGGNSNKESVNVQSDNLFLDKLFSENLPETIDGLRTPLVFMGGNIFIDRFNGHKIAFCGSDVLKDTRIVWQACYGESLEEKKFAGMIKKYLNVDKVFILGKKKPQPPYMFHLDQAMILLPGGVAGVTNIVGKESDINHGEINKIKSFMAEVRSVLKKLGYKLIDIDTSTIDVLNYKFYINSIPYIDKKTGQKKILMPVPKKKFTAIEKNLIKKNISAFESVGYDVVTVPSESTSFNGGIHCLINVIK